jgi:hypothetical protein
MTVEMHRGRIPDALTVSKIIKNVHKECNNLHQQFLATGKN